MSVGVVDRGIVAVGGAHKHKVRRRPIIPAAVLKTISKIDLLDPLGLGANVRGVDAKHEHAPGGCGLLAHKTHYRVFARGTPRRPRSRKVPLAVGRRVHNPVQVALGVVVERQADVLWSWFASAARLDSYEHGAVNARNNELGAFRADVALCAAPVFVVLKPCFGRPGSVAAHKLGGQGRALSKHPCGKVVEDAATSRDVGHVACGG